MAGTLRFQALIDRCGRPTVYTPWIDPLKDRALQKARKENRVLTIHQNVHGTKDYGEVGFELSRGTEFLIISKSLRWAEGKRVVGIHYEAIAEPKFPSEAAAKSKKTSKPLRAKRAGRAAAVLSKTVVHPYEPVRAEVRVDAESKKENSKAAEPIKRDPLTERLKSVLNDLERKRVIQARSALRKLIAEREES